MIQDNGHLKSLSHDNGDGPVRLGRVLPSQMTIYHQGDQASGFYLVNSGVVMVYRLLDNSDRQISGFYTKGDFFGMCGTDTHQDTAITVSTSNIVFLKMSDVQKDAKLLQKLFEVTCEQLEETQSLMTVLTRKTATEKVAYFLLMLATQRHAKGETFELNLPMSRLDIADYLGLSIETVSRRLTVLKLDKVISLPDRDTVHIHKFSELKRLAGMI